MPLSIWATIVSGLIASPAVHRAIDAMHAQAVLTDRDLHGLGDDRAEGLVHGDAAEMPGRRRRLPIGHLGRLVEHRAGARFVRQQVAAEGVRLLSGGLRQLVDKPLDVELVMLLPTERQNPTGTPTSLSTYS